jgi:hypothetical protein
MPDAESCFGRHCLLCCSYYSRGPLLSPVQQENANSYTCAEVAQWWTWHIETDPDAVLIPAARPWQLPCTLGTRGGELAAEHPHVLGRSCGLERWSCYLDICVGAALRPGRIAVCDRRVQSKYSVLQSEGVRDPTLAY